MQISIEKTDEQKKEAIISDSLPFIRHTAYRLAYRLPRQLSVNDLISVGIVGLLDALQRYTEGRVKLNTFVEYRIRGAMLDELRSHDWMPRSLKDKVSRIRKAGIKLERDSGRIPEAEEVARSVDMTLDEYYRALERASSAVVFSFEDFRDPSSESSVSHFAESIPDTSMKTPLELLEENTTREALTLLIDGLSEREKLVLSLYYWEEFTLKEIGRILKLSEGRICQIHNEALLKLKTGIGAFGLA